MSNASIIQIESKKDQGDRVMPRINEAIDVLESCGYNIKDQSYKEQSYYKKTIKKQTAEHGQFKFDMNCNSHGATVIGSNDCQLPMMVFLGVNYNGEVLPMVKTLEIKNLACNNNKVFLLTHFIAGARETLFNQIATLKNKVYTQAESLAVFTEIQGYRRSIMNCLTCVPIVTESNGYNLFLTLVDTFINGAGISTSGKKVRRITHIRHKVQIVEKILEILSQ